MAMNWRGKPLPVAVPTRRPSFLIGDHCSCNLFTPQKFNMEPKRSSHWKKNHLNQTSIFSVAYEFSRPLWQNNTMHLATFFTDSAPPQNSAEISYLQAQVRERGKKMQSFLPSGSFPQTPTKRQGLRYMSPHSKQHKNRSITCGLPPFCKTLKVMFQSLYKKGHMGNPLLS